ncbi:MAG: response regulator [Bacteroidota bacterium]
MAHQKTILWVEDEEEQSSVLSKLFTENGFLTVVRDNAEEALQVLRDFTPDIMLVDIKLRDSNGLDFFYEIKKTERLKNVPIVFLTAFNSLQMAIDAKNKGATDYITKPFDIDYLIERIKEIVAPE